ncbi:MAG: LETM1 domain-containing protein [Chryseolinea sp.]
MKTGTKGWLKDYLSARQARAMEDFVEARKRASHPEHSLYRVIQPTGLMYGLSVSDEELLHHPEEQKDRLKILLTESLISSSIVSYDKPITTPSELEQLIHITLEKIGTFYNNIFPEVATATKTLLGRKKSPYEVAEQLIDKRIEYTAKFANNFWSFFFHNSLLFLDVFIFGQWIHTNADRIVADFFRYERDELRFSVVKVIAAAAHANREVSFEERRFYDLFIESAELSSERRKETLKIFEEGFAVEDINLPTEHSWILKKFFLEISILTIWADKKVEQEELDFLKRFCHYLELSDEDLESSMIAIEGFILEHWSALERLQDKRDIEYVSEQFIYRVSRLAEKNKTKLAKYLNENAELNALTRKARGHELTVDEKEQLRNALVTMIKTLPAFSVIPLPQAFLSLPVLLKILPRNLFVEGIK